MELLTGSPPVSAGWSHNTKASAFVDMLKLNLSPVIFVLCTPEADAICKKNDMSFVDILRPHCFLNSISVPVRTSSEQTFRLPDFSVRVFSPHDMVQPKAEVAEAYLAQLVTDASDKAASELAGDPADLQAVLKMAQAETRSSWFQEYIQNYGRSLSFASHEALDHPVACILVTASSQSSPVDAFRDLYSGPNLPASITEGAADPHLHKHYVLLHDLQTGPAEGAAEALAEMQATFGTLSCRLLPINSREAGQGLRPDIWTPHLVEPQMPRDPSRPPSLMDDPKGLLGQLLSDKDVREVAEFVAELVVKAVIPHLEQRAREYNFQVAANRKGLRNQIKNLWFRKTKEDTPAAPPGVYTYKSVESQLRVLADYALMLRDYELALSTLRLLASDYKSDKAWKQYAGAQEMIGVCLFFLDQSRREIEAAMESAYSSYQRCGAGRHSTRAALWLAEMYKARRQFRDAAQALMRASLEEGSLRAGVMLEQTALCFLRITPPMVRKYGFHMVLAGNRYNLCGQRKHAVRAYRLVSAVYNSCGWNFICDHCSFTLARLSAFMGEYAAAEEFLVGMLVCPHQTATMQATFLREFMLMAQSAHKGGEDEAMELGLPVVSTRNMHVHWEDHRTYSSPSAGALGEETWAALEEKLVPATVASGVATWLDVPVPRSSGSAPPPTNTCVVGEDVAVDVELHNPLHITLSLTRLRLLCTFTSHPAGVVPVAKGGEPPSPAADEFASISVGPGSKPASDSACSAGNSGETIRGESSDSGLETLTKRSPPAENSAVEVQEEVLELRGGERTTVRLQIRVRQRGLVHIDGVAWLLRADGRQAHGRCTFQVVQQQLRLPGRGASAALPPHLRLHLVITSAMPRLEVQMHGLPERLWEGEVQRCVLELSNVSQTPLTGLKLKCNQPAVFMVGRLEDLNRLPPACLEDWPATPAGAADAAYDPELGIYSFPPDLVLEGGSTLLWPVWVRARQPGNLALHLSLLYSSPEGAAAPMPYRTLRAVYNVQVMEGLRVKATISPSSKGLQHAFMRLDVENLHTSESFWLRQVSCVSTSWGIAPLSPEVPQDVANEAALSTGGNGGQPLALLQAQVAPPQLLTAGTSLSLLFQLQEDEGVTAVGKASQEGSLPRDVQLGSAANGGTQPTVTIRQGPLLHFHTEERHCQEREAASNTASNGGTKVSRPPLDVVLVWEPGQMTNGGQPQGAEGSSSGLPLGTYHICNCRVESQPAVQWLVEGPTVICHNFKEQPVCQVALRLVLRNNSLGPLMLRIDTLDPASNSISADLSPRMGPTDAAPPFVKAGWFEASSQTDSRETTTGPSSVSVLEHVEDRQCGCPSLGLYMWCGMTSTPAQRLASGATFDIHLQAVVFEAGVFDFSSYRVMWQADPVMPHGHVAADTLGKGSPLAAFAKSGFAQGQPWLVRVVQDSYAQH